MPCFAKDFGDFSICSEITDCGKSEQTPASCYYLLVVKLVVKGKGLLLRDFLYTKRPSYRRPLIILYDQFGEATHHYLILSVQFQTHIHQTNFVQDVKKLYLYHLSQFDVYLVQLLQ